MKLDTVKILKRLCVRPGLHMTSWVVQDCPYIVVDMFYDRDDKLFKLRLSCPGGRGRTIALQPDDVKSASKSQWMTDRTYRLTDSAITRLQPGLEAALTKALEVFPVESETAEA